VPQPSPDPFANAPAEVREAARVVEGLRLRVLAIHVVVGVAELSVLFGSSLAHDLYGFGEPAVLAMLFTGSAAVLGPWLWSALRGSVGVARRAQEVAQSWQQRERLRSELGLDSVSSAAPSAALSAAERLSEQIEAKAGDREEVRAAVERARARAAVLARELAGLSALGATAGDGALTEQLAGARAEIEREHGRIEVQLAEIYAALVAIDAAGAGEEAAGELAGSLAQLEAELEVAVDRPRPQQADARARARPRPRVSE
jgi:hypothetical protein